MRAFAIGCFLLLLPSAFASAATFDVSGYDAACGIAVKQEGTRLIASWPISDDEHGALVLEFNPDQPLIAELGIAAKSEGERTPIVTNIDPATYLTVGTRDLSQQGWNAFFDNPPRRPFETFPVKLEKRNVTVTSRGQRCTIAIDGVTAGTFSGELCFTLYAGCSLVHAETVVSTKQDACAILYDTGLTATRPFAKSIGWLDTSDKLQTTAAAAGHAAEPLAVRHRTIGAETERGAIAIFPPPHQYLYPLDFADNFKLAWWGRGFHKDERWGLGVRQPPQGDGRFVPWINAPPGTKQRLGVFYLLARNDAAGALAEVRAFTRGDKFKKLAGFRTFTSHYHVEHTLDFLRRQREQGTTGVPRGLENPPFVKTFQDHGVEIVHLAEFHVGHSPDFIKQRLPQLMAMHAECRRLSSDDFLLLPGEEPNVHLGGHWISFFPKPVYWLLHPDKETPFEREVEGLGKVYAVHNADDVLRLMEKENGLMWTAHARTKSSFGFPDRYRAQAFYKSDRFLGAAWKAMPADLSHPRLGMRVLDLFDDMANWGQQKYVLGEVDVFKVMPDYELYGHMNVNYLKLDKLPRYDDGWQSICDALRNGQFFVTTGEVLLTEFRVSGKESGATLRLDDKGEVEVDATLEWTFPPAFVEVIWGDGEKVMRKRVTLEDRTAFGSHALSVSLAMPGAKWVRLEAWDVAANGAFSQPVWVE